MDIATILINLKEAFSAILKSIFNDLSILWFLAPLILFWIILEVYFSKYKKEELGWNTALGNGLSVFWILIVSTKYLFENHMENFEWPKFIAIIIIMIYALFIIINSFEHKLNAKVSFLLAAPTIIYYLSAVAIIWTYGNLEITIWVLIDLIIIYLIAMILELILKKSIKGKEDFGSMDLGKGSDFKEPDFGSSFGETDKLDNNLNDNSSSFRGF